MEKNVGNNDRIIRAVLGVVSIYFAYTYSAWIYIATAILLGTAAVGRCGLYGLLGINTCKVKLKKK